MQLGFERVSSKRPRKADEEGEKRERETDRQREIERVRGPVFMGSPCISIILRIFEFYFVTCQFAEISP